MGLAGGFLLMGAALAALILAGSKAAGAVGSGGSPAGAPGTAPDAQGMASDRNYLASQGLTKIAAAGIVGNLWQESSGSPTAPGGGLAQWIGARWQALTTFAAQHGLDPNANATQLEFLVSELRGSYPGLIAQLNAAGSPAEAATLFQNVYERPDPASANLPARQAYAQQAFDA